jgi:hypothetical protein
VRAAAILALMMVAASTSETSVKFYQTKLRNISEGSHLLNRITITYIVMFYFCEALDVAELSRLPAVMSAMLHGLLSVRDLLLEEIISELSILIHSGSCM